MESRKGTSDLGHGALRGSTYNEQGSSSVRSDKYTLAKWINSIPIACLEVSKNLQRECRRPN